MNLLIHAGLDYVFNFATFEVLDRLEDREGRTVSKVVTRVGGARCIEAYAQARGLPIVRLVPDFDEYGSKAIVNCLKEMAEYADCAAIYPGGYEAMECYVSCLEAQIPIHDFRGI